MVLQTERASPLQGAFQMASNSDSWTEESTRDSPTDSPQSYTELQPKDPLQFYPHLDRPVYVPYVPPPSSFVLLPYPYSISTVVLPEEVVQAEGHLPTSLEEDSSLRDSNAAYKGAASSFDGMEDPSFTTPDAENTDSSNVHFDYGWKFLTLRDSSIPSQQCPRHSSQRVTWTFDFPAQLCGRLIGKKGRNICKLMQETYTQVTVYEDKENDMKEIIQVCGAESQVLEATWKIEELFARKRSSYGLTNSRALPIVHPETAVSHARQMELPINTEVNVIISYVITAGHFYLVMPRHCATAASVNDFETQINRFYDSGHIPRLDLESTLVGTYCVGNLDGKWFRVQVIGILPKARKVEVVLLDCGRLAIIPLLSLRKMRVDFLDVPFQAIECSLANIVPRGSDYFFPPSGASILEKHIEKKKLKAICRGIHAGISIVDLYSTDKDARTWINQMLVDVGVAQWSQIAL